MKAIGRDDLIHRAMNLCLMVGQFDFCTNLPRFVDISLCSCWRFNPSGVAAKDIDPVILEKLTLFGCKGSDPRACIDAPGIEQAVANLWNDQ
jgi:hypothetical protein